MISCQASVDPAAIVSPTAIIHPFAVICAGASISEQVVIGNGCFVGKNVFIAPGCRIQGGSFIPTGWSLGDQVFIGPNVTFCNVKRPVISEHPSAPTFSNVAAKSVIGAGAVILPGVFINASCRIAAGSVVTKSCLSANGWYRGNPARFYAD